MGTIVIVITVIIVTVITIVIVLQGAIHVNDRVVPQPPLQKLSAEKLTREGVFLMDCGSVSYYFDSFLFRQ